SSQQPQPDRETAQWTSLRRFLESYLSRWTACLPFCCRTTRRRWSDEPLPPSPECQWAVEAVVKRGRGARLLPGGRAGPASWGSARPAPSCSQPTDGQMTIVLLSCQPLVVTLIGQPDCNIGAMTGLLKDRAFSEQLAPLAAGSAAGVRRCGRRLRAS
uniref:SpoU_methylase domain-containing protein n=1 Tax=Macrostomum lignano TaxID=282301 RepID=A0A1I8FKQ1_9PLAT